MHFKQLIKNFFSLSLLQAVNYIVPLLLLPFIISKVGIGNYGIANYVVTVFVPLKILIDYGYNLSAIRDIAAAANNKAKVGDIISRLLITKFFLLVVVFLCLLLCIWLIPLAKESATILLLSFTLVVGQSFLPMWYFQAIEKAGVMVVFSVITRVLYIGLIFFLIQTPSDYIYLNFYLGISDILLTVFAFGYIIFRDRIGLSFVNALTVKEELTRNFSIANVSVLTNLCLSFPLISLGIFSSKTVVGYYGVADKILQVLRTSVVILYGSSFPRVMALYRESLTALSLFVRRLHLIILGVYIPVAIFCLVYPEIIVGMFVDEIPSSTVIIVRIFAFIPLIAALDIIPSHFMLITNRNNLYAKMFLVSSIFSIIVSISLVYAFDFLGAAVSALLVEVFILLLLVLANRKMLGSLLLTKN